MGDDPDAANMIGQILILVILILVNAYFAGAEMAVVSVNKNKIRKLAEGGNKKAALIQQLLENSTGFLSTIQVAITFAGFFSSASAATGISQVLAGKLQAAGIPCSESAMVAVVTVLLSFFTLVFGELVPKRIALQKAEWFSLFTVRPIYVISKIMKPFIALLSVSTNGFLKLIGMKTEGLESEVSEEEIRAMLETGRAAGVFNEIEEEMITSVFSFDDKRAKEIMVPRQEMTAVDITRPAEEYLEELLQSRHTRIPVYEGEIDNVVGILSMKDYSIEAKKTSFYNVDIRSIMQEPYFVPENQKINRLFAQMQKEKIRMAVLVDEYGGVSGLVTIEDLVEEIVGDICEEYEEEEKELVQKDASHYTASGSLPLYDLREGLGLKLSSDCDTLSGYLIEQLGFIPDPEQLPQVIEKERARFTVTAMEGKVIHTVEIELAE